MVPHGLQLVQQVVQPEGGHTQGTVGPVGLVARHWGTPEVVQPDVDPRDIGSDVGIVHDDGLVVEAEATVESISIE